MCFQWFGAFGARSLAPASESARISGGRISWGARPARAKSDGLERLAAIALSLRPVEAGLENARPRVIATMLTVAPADSQFAKAQFTFMRFGPPRKLFFTHMAGSASST